MAPPRTPGPVVPDAPRPASSWPPDALASLTSSSSSSASHTDRSHWNVATPSPSPIPSASATISSSIRLGDSGHLEPSPGLLCNDTHYDFYYTKRVFMYFSNTCDY
ncbi:uncharacterized protein [Triticum aestivum]|uniref:uncharacterized protein n=1 Tax=Triticum aestivum TaxID=4565 RepID=UPI001D01EABD|nr:uncharacterized protein LOC123125684 [Triticum aestivum]